MRSAVPPVSIALPTSAGVIPIDRPKFPLSYSALTVDTDAAPLLRLEVPELWSYTLPPSANQPLPAQPPAGRFSHQAAEVVPVNPTPYRPYPITVVAELNGESYREGYRTIGYPGIQGTNLYSPSTFHVTAADVHTPPGLNIAYLPGTGDDVAAYLPYLGVKPAILSVADLTAVKLKEFDAVVLGVRAYAAHPELAGAGSRPLIDYAKNGGVVIVQYNTARYGDAEAPFAITVPGSSDMNVVEEADPVMAAWCPLRRCLHGRTTSQLRISTDGLQSAATASHARGGRSSSRCWRRTIPVRMRRRAGCWSHALARATTSTRRLRCIGSFPKAYPGAYRV